MQEVFEKIIEKLQEKFKYNSEQAEIWRSGEKVDAFMIGRSDDYIDRANCYGEAIKIVKQEAEEYNNVMIDGKYCFQTCACTEKCDKCSRLCNGDVDWYENIDNWVEEFATDTNVGTNGWIPCSERLPECENGCETTALMFQLKTGTIEVGYFGVGGKIREKYFRHYRNSTDGVDASDVVAWQPLPAPFRDKE